MADYNTITTYNGDGTTTDYSIPFTYQSASEVVVTRQNGAVTFTFVNPNLIRINAALAVGDVLVVQRVTDITDPVVTFANGSVQTAQQFNAAFAQSLNAAQESVDLIGNLTSAVTAAASAEASATSASASASSATSSASTATTKASEASTSATNAASSATSAGTSATNASNSASSASGSATAASGSASAAATSATNAASSATSADSAKTAAESARDSTLAAFDSFDDRYLGAKASDPTVDNDGNALAAGTLYFNTAAQEMRLYTGSAWVAAYVSGGGFVTPTGVDTLTNKTINLTSNTLSGTKAQFNTAMSDADFATIAGTETLTGKTLTDPAIVGAILEDIYTITDGAAFEIDPGNGTMQIIVLGASRTPKATNFANGESVLLMVDDGTAYALTWTDTTFGASGVKWVGGTAPTLDTTGYTLIEFFKVGGQVYGALVGSVA